MKSKFKYGVYVTYDRGSLKSIRERISRHISYSAADAAMVRAKRKYNMSCCTVSGESATGMQNATFKVDKITAEG